MEGKQRPRSEPEGENDSGGAPRAGGPGSCPCQGISMSMSQRLPAGGHLVSLCFVSRPGATYEQRAHKSWFSSCIGMAPVGRSPARKGDGTPAVTLIWW